MSPRYHTWTEQYYFGEHWRLFFLTFLATKQSREEVSFLSFHPYACFDLFCSCNTRKNLRKCIFDNWLASNLSHFHCSKVQFIERWSFSGKNEVRKFFLSEGILSFVFLYYSLSPLHAATLDESSDCSHLGGALFYSWFSSWKIESRVSSHHMDSLSELCSKDWIRITRLNIGHLVKF